METDQLGFLNPAIERRPLNAGAILELRQRKQDVDLDLGIFVVEETKIQFVER